MSRGRKMIDLTGRRFGRWTVLRFHERRPGKYHVHLIWWCRCDCGKEKAVFASNMKHGLSTGCWTCGAMKYRPGDKLGMRVLVRHVGRTKGWVYRCTECGLERRGAAGVLAKTQCKRCGVFEHPRDAASGTAKPITIGGETHSLKGWGAKLGLSRYTVSLRIKNGWPIEKACTTPRIPRSLSRLGWEAA